MSSDDCDEPEVLTGQRLCVLADYRPVSAPRVSQVYLLYRERTQELSRSSSNSPSSAVLDPSPFLGFLVCIGADLLGLV